MKNKISRLLSLLVILLLLGSCTETYELKTGFDASESLIMPAVNELVAIDLENGTTTKFEWTKSNSYYGGVVIYEVVFDKENGDFTNPIFKTVSNGGGGDTWLSLTPKQLIALAKLANIAVDSEGTVKWKVIASQGGERKETKEIRTLRLKRPAGIGEIPNELFIYGSGFEAKNLENAMQTKKIEDGVFEIFASLSDGQIKLCNSTAANKIYYILGSNNKLVEADNESGIEMTGTGKAYRIVIDFNLLTIRTTEIKAIQMMRTWQYNLGDLTYIGNHKFEVKNIAFPYYHDWGYPEERYRFWIDTNEGREIWGSYHNDQMNASNLAGLVAFNTQPDGSQPDTYYNVYNLADIPSAGQNQDWTGMYKLPKGSENKHANVVIDMSPAGAYKHSVNIID
ncbi:SusE domain-containing protein [Flavobacterium aquicola]|uniref:SusE-like outer membrane protein n=1 Tax=Flavobacterium aquicola TaxID=1682742 RepID=A0A3E0EC31_9FLAO|nr:SusE domain-containing protein [Flavobacterium aquicola]REG94789.1 SusE-like outer membrane protein [Flavobacterium aquicola]